jgi:hypothetical protein
MSVFAIMDRTEREQFMVRYLLGQVSPEERDTLEDRYLVDEGPFEELVAAENDLIDSYARGNLSPVEAQLFEQNFLVTTQRRERVEFARAMLDHTSAPSRSEAHAGTFSHARPWISTGRLATAAIYIAAVTAVIWLGIYDLGLRRQISMLQQQELQLRQQIQELTAQLQSFGVNHPMPDVIPLPPPGSTTISMVLVPAARGGDRQNTVFIAPNTWSVSLLLRRPQENYVEYAVSLETVEGTRLQVQKDLKAQRASTDRVVAVEFLSASLKTEDYVLRLSGRDSLGKEDRLDAYSFRILKR